MMMHISRYHVRCIVVAVQLLVNTCILLSVDHTVTCGL